MRSTLLALLVACGADQPLNPVGTWQMTILYGQGDCGLTGVDELERFVSPGLVYSGFDADRAAEAVITCDASMCLLAFSETTPTTTFAGAWTLDSRDAINGSGSTRVDSSAGSCSQAWTAIGALR